MSGNSQTFMLSLTAMISILPAFLIAVKRREFIADHLYWITLVIATTGPLLWSVTNASDQWLTGLPTALWLSITTSMIVFISFHIFNKNVARLNKLFIPWMLVFSALALFSNNYPGAPLDRAKYSGWIELHITMSLVTYAALTIGAIAAFAALLREKSLKSKRPNAFTASLPSVADCHQLMTLSLKLGGIVLIAGLLSGMVLDLTFYGTVFVLDHKTILTLAAVFCICALLYAHHNKGVRGHQTTRMVFIIYLLVTLGYPGVKFVETVLLN